MSAGNKKVTQLVALTATEVAADDLFYIVDVSAKESKKIQADELAMYLSISGSLYVISATYADTASYVLGSDVDGLVDSSSFSVFSMTAVSASWAENAKSASWGQRSLTASYAHNASGGSSVSASYADFSKSASYAQNASMADNAQVAAFLYYSGGNNGTASYAVATGLVNRAIRADTASYLDGGSVPSVASASWANMAGRAITASSADQATFLAYSPNNGTASYAISAGSIGGSKMNYYGLATAQTQSSDSAVISVLDVRSSLSQSKETLIDVYGNAILCFTASLLNYPSLSLWTRNRDTGTDTLLDSAPFWFNTTPVINQWNTLQTGSFNAAFHLIGQQSMYGRYYLILSSSSPLLQIESASNRPVRFVFASYSDNLYTSWDTNPTEIEILPWGSVICTYYMTGSGPYVTAIDELIFSGSNKVSALDISNQNVTDVKYTYQLETMSFFRCDMNPTLTKFDYRFPDTLMDLWCSDNALSFIYDLTNTQLLNLSCSYNELNSLPDLPSSLVYLDCSYNINLRTLPDLPGGLTVLLANGTHISASSGNFLPTSLVSASFSGSVYFSSLQAPLPTGLTYLNLAGTSVITMPTLSTGIIYLDVKDGAFSTTEIENFTTDLVANGQLNGYLDLRGYGTFTSPTILSNISTLTFNGWTVLSDP